MSGIEAQLADHPQDSLNMAVGFGAGGAKGILGGDEGFALEAAANQRDGGFRQV